MFRANAETSRSVCKKPINLGNSGQPTAHIQNINVFSNFNLFVFSLQIENCVLPHNK